MKQKNIALILILNIFAFVGTVVLVANPLPSESNPHLLKTTESKTDKNVLEFVKRLLLANQSFSSNQSLNNQSLVLPVQTNRYNPPKELAFHVQTNKYEPQEILVLNTQAETEDLLGTDFMVADYVCEFAEKNDVRLDNIVFSPKEDNCSRQVIDFANETSCAREYQVYQNFFTMKKPKKRYLECVNAVKNKLVANVDSLIEERRKKEAEAVARIEGEEFWGTDFAVQDYICEYLAKNKVHSGNVVFSPKGNSCTLQVVHFLNKTSCESEYNTCRNLLRMGKSIPTKYVDCVHTYRNILISKVDSWIEEIARQEKLKKEAEARAERERLEEIARQEKLKKEAEEKAERERLAEIAKQEQLKKEAEERIALRKTPNPASDFTYELNKSGNGVLIKGYVGKDSKVFIPAQIEGFPVTEIKSSSLCYGKELTSVVIPDSVTKIGIEIFNNCEALGQVVLPKNLTKIPAKAFKECKSLTVIKLPHNLKIIGAEAFAESGLKTIEFPDSLTTIEAGAFSNAHLSSIELPSSLIIIEAAAFAYNDLENVVIPNSVTKMEGGVLGGNENIRSLTLSKNIKTLHCPFGFLEGEGIGEFCSWNDDSNTCENLVELKNIKQLKFNQTEYSIYDAGRDRTFSGCSKLPLSTQKKLRDIGYKGNF